MFFGDQATETRSFFTQSWQKYLQKQPLEALESQIVQVILEHPEYHALFHQDEQSVLEYSPKDYEENPFLHLGLHLAVRDQLQLKQPRALGSIFQKILKKTGDKLEAEHRVMAVLAESIWDAQQQGREPSLEDYISKLSII